jgi:nucleoside-diphosphate-sugar epimerase
VFNLGSGSTVTINDLAKAMIDISGINTKIIFAPERPADVKHCKANAEKAKQILGFNPSVELIKGLEEYMKWFKDNCI